MVYEGGCQEGNYALMDMLINTRAAEKLFSEGKGPIRPAMTMYLVVPQCRSKQQVDFGVATEA
jgi:hypothetical protein